MRRSWWIAVAGLCLVGCISPVEERFRQYSSDGAWLFERGDYEAAAENFQVALSLKPNDANLLYNLGETYHKRGAFAQAESYYNKCLEQEPGHVPCRWTRAQLLVQMGRPADAAQLVQEWLGRQPDSADACALAGWYHHQAGDLPRAQVYLQQALEREPHNQRALVEMGLLYEALHRPERAVSLYERVLADDPNHAEVKKRYQALLAQGAGRPQPE